MMSELPFTTGGQGSQRGAPESRRGRRLRRDSYCRSGYPIPAKWKEQPKALIVLSDNDESVIIANVKAILAAIEVIQPGALLWVDLGVSHEG